MWSAIPDLRSTRALVAVVAAASLLAILFVALTSLPLYLRGFGDTDDAVRLVLVRELMSGRPWYHPEILRLQYPTGALMHWSRLIDGGIAGLERLLALALPHAKAESAARAIWPLLWLPPAILAVCVVARRLAGSGGLLVAGLLCAMSLPALEQFRPGRIDHHNVQIALCLIAASAAMITGSRWRLAVLAGFSSGLGLAIGTEAILFHAIIGLAFAVSLLTGRPGGVAAARAYGVAIAASTATAYLVQTPPALWSASVCDTLGANLVSAVTLGGLGLAGSSFTPPGWVRSIAILAVGGASACAYIFLHPSCLHGPMGDVPPLIRSYVDRMGEMEPAWELWARDRLAVDWVIGPAIAALIIPMLLARNGRLRQLEWLLLATLLYVAFGLGLLHIRLLSYANWFAIPVIATGLASTAAIWRRLLVPTVLATALISPAPATGAIIGLTSLLAPPSSAPRPSRGAVGTPVTTKCSDHVAFDRLRRLPAKFVLADLDTAPFILAETTDAVLAGPYHRLSPGLTETFRLFSEPVDQARRDLSMLHIGYVVACPDEANKADHALIGSSGLLGQLDRRMPPAWLEPLSLPADRLQVYAVRP